MKKCSSCLTEKPFSLFAKDKTRKDGFFHKCKPCHSKYRQTKEQKQKITEYWHSHYKENKPKYAAKRAKRRAIKLQATPKWLSKSDFIAIECKYSLASMFTKCSGVSHAVDHIVPLQGKTVCGLHVPWNLQVITVIDNLQKGNKFNGETITTAL
jgi:hypothetical protein